jgi:trans-aconitate methyltransferase
MSQSSVAFAQVIAQTLKDNFGQLNREQTLILDYGCGDGLLMSFMHELFWHANIIGVDKPSVIATAKKEFPDLQFETIEFIDTCQPASFDLIYLANVLHHVPLNDRKILFKQLSTLLKPNGYLAIIELNPWNLFSRIRHAIDPYELDAPLISSRRVKNLLPAKNSRVKYYGSIPSVLLHNERMRLLSMYLPWGSWYLLFFF